MQNRSGEFRNNNEATYDKDVWNEPGVIQSINIRSQRKVEQPSAQPPNENAASEPTLTNIFGEKAEKERANESALRRIGKKAAIMAGVLITTGAAVFGAKNSEATNQPMSKEAWEDTMRDSLGKYGGTANLDYSEDGGTITITDKRDINGETVETSYYLKDKGANGPDGDIDWASASNKLGGAGYESDGDGVTPQAAIDILNRQMEQGE